MIITNELGTPALNTVHNCRAEALLSACDSGSIDLIVTSPPYDNLRTYNGFAWNFEYIAQQSYRVLKTGGVLVWVVGDATVNGSESLSSFKQAIYFVEEAGFRLHDTMIYEKSTSAFPESNRYLALFEYMFILSKGSPVTANLMKTATVSNHRSSVYRDADGKMKPMKYAMGHETKVISNVWRFDVGYMQTAKDTIAFEHPAIFPESLVERHILTWSNAGDVVLDYFGGSGTTAKMARKNGRHYLTCDISREYCDLMERRLAQPYTPMFAEMLA